MLHRIHKDYISMLFIPIIVTLLQLAHRVFGLLTPYKDFMGADICISLIPGLILLHVYQRISPGTSLFIRIMDNREDFLDSTYT